VSIRRAAAGAGGSADAGALPVQPLYFESNNNNLFGTGAGANTITGSCNAFFGREAGSANTTGSYIGLICGY
jgi:hypothetical protein